MDYVDASGSIREFLKAAFFDDFKSFRTWKIEAQTPLPCLLVKTIGKSTIQLLVRSESDIEALEKCTEVGNYLKRNFSDVSDVNIFDADFQMPPIPTHDDDSGKEEAWCYMQVIYFES
ncbi:hypothetical protein ACFFH2_02570 [Enterococcus devriesei]|uniref:Uncharacterized protein n=1 Tax=Enterococcus devriesei TaxID=319970 RepID=A0A1L8SNV2_9ENTE|nr:hypothetical protein [Enterococcus devriesei]OJG33746.1 hypothetical protein RV00_GL001000 [Enterococcus devriesei]